MDKVYFQKGENYNINKDKIVKVTKYDVSKSIEIVDASNYKNGFDRIEKISKYEYYDIKTNSTKLYRINGFKSKEGLSKSMKRLEKKLKNNFLGDDNELFVTLTTADELTDIEEIKYYFKVFWGKLKTIYDGLEYAYVLERCQKKNGWHFHLLLKDIKNKKLYIPNSTIEKLWNRGYTKVSRIVNDRKKYANIDEEEYIENMDDITDCCEESFGINKVISYMTKIRTKQKLPKGTRCYDTSRGLKSPKTEQILYSDICSKMDNTYRLETEKTLLVRDTYSKAIINKIKKENWKKI